MFKYSLEMNKIMPNIIEIVTKAYQMEGTTQQIFINEAIKASQIKSQAKGQSTLWFPAGPNSVPNNLTGYMENGIGRVNCVAFSPTNTNTYYVGVAQGGIWKTTNGGVTWTVLTDNLSNLHVFIVILKRYALLKMLKVKLCTRNKKAPIKGPFS